MPPKRLQKNLEKKQQKSDAKDDKAEAGKKEDDQRKEDKKPRVEKETPKMTLCTKPVAERAQRRPGRPANGKKMMAREMPGKIRSAYRRSLDPCENSNDSGLGFDHHADPHQHTALMSERLVWTEERAEAKRMRLDIKLENEEANDSYCFPANVRQCKENISIIRTAPSGTVPSLSISGSASNASGRAVPRCAPVISRQTPTGPVSLTSQLCATSRFGDVALTIVKQPEQQHRARYQTEGSRGAVKDREGNGFPIVQLTGYYKPATLQVYIGTDVGKVSPHMFYQACKVSGKNSTPCVENKIDGTCVIELALDPTKDMCATCDCVGILKERNVDVEHRFPDQLGNRSKKKSTRCRMIFRTTITHDSGTIETLQVCSQPIVCTQPPGIPEICKKSLTSCPASGGLELFVLGKNFLKDTKVYFQQYDEGRVCWEQAVAPDKEYLQQTHFVCVVPPYRRPNITEPVSVRLCVVSSGKTSETHQFVYTPVNGAVSVNLEAQHASSVSSSSSIASAAPTAAQFFKGALWNSGPSYVRKHEQDLDMMPPPESHLVPSRRSSISLHEVPSPPQLLHHQSLKQEYVDDSSQGSLDVNHDSNISMINDNSVDMLHHMDESSCNAQDLRMKLPMNATVTDLVTTASSMATLKSFGIEPTTEPLPTQSAQSVENYLTRIESKPVDHLQVPPKGLLVSAPQDSAVFLTSQQPFLPETNAINTIAKSEAAAVAEQQTLSGSTNTLNTCTTITTALGRSITTPINSQILNSETIMAPQDVLLSAEPSMMISSQVMTQQESHSPPTLSPAVILNSQLSPTLMCGSAGANVQQETLTETPALLPVVTTQDSTTLLSAESEKAVLLEAAVDFLKTQKKISEMTTSAPDILCIASSATLSGPSAMGGGFGGYAGGTAPPPMPLAKENDKKNEDRMIPQDFPSLTENELISLINPSCFDQGNGYHH